MIKSCLIVFVRYPEADKVKTRLIPALGAEGSASVYKQMAEHTLAQVRELSLLKNVSVQIWFTGGSIAQMNDWLGDDLDYQTQPKGDLGDRLLYAFQTAFSQGNESVIAIGTDCPSLSSSILFQGFQALKYHSLILGPATDGGYYLIGMKQLIPEVFNGIAWSTFEVLQQTVKIAKELGLVIAYLPTLTDIDTPEDLKIWEQVKANKRL
ncbi:MAG: TIGR04282 family arsenosugar biosynthesis glycosyltransferase [Leptolyngbyaceae cyanobacterium]